MCWDRVHEFIDLIDKIERESQRKNNSKTQLVLIGSASPNKMYELAMETHVDPNFVFSDMDACLYNAFGAQRGIINTFIWKRGMENVHGFLDFGRQGLCKCRWPMYNAGMLKCHIYIYSYK